MTSFFNPYTYINPNQNGTPGTDYSSMMAYGSPQPAVSLPNEMIPYSAGDFQFGSKPTVPTTQMPKFGMNLNTLQTGLNTAQTGMNIWSAWKAASLAQQQLDYARKIGDANLANAQKSYNTNLEGRANMNAVVGGWNSQQLQDYIDRNKLTGK